MTITTYNTFINNLADLTITGVVRSFDGPPASVETADLPCQFPRVVEGTEGPLTVQASGGWPTFRGSLVILLQPIAQDTPPLNHAAVVDMADNISTTLRAITSSGTLGRGPIEWETSLVSNEILGERQYWALVTTVTGYG